MTRRRCAAAALASAMSLAACQSLPNQGLANQNWSKPPPLAEPRTGFAEVGIASWYGPGFHGKRTANGERFNMHGMTAAHRTLPINTRVRVVDLETGRSVIVRINDRGPYVADRIIDLSAGAAGALDLKGRGVARVRIESLGTSNKAALNGPPARFGTAE